MSVSVHTRQTRKPYEVRWEEPGGKQRSRSFTRRRDADRFDQRVKRLKEQGRLRELDAEGVTLAQFGATWWERAKRDLEGHTRNSYSQQWNKHVLPRLGRTPLAQITPLVIEDFRGAMEKDGVGAPTVRLAMAVLQAALARAVVWGYLETNPSIAVRKPSAKAKPRRPISPERVEAMRALLLAGYSTTKLRRNGRPMTTAHPADPASATLVSVLAYAGLRPEEALALTWGDVGVGTIRIENAVALGEQKLTKTEHPRTVRLLAPLAEDLDAHRGARMPAASRLVFGRGGELWSDSDYRNWRRRTYARAGTKAGFDDLRPYTLRASFASLLIAEGHPITYVAAQCGHSVETCLRHYALLFEEFAGRPNIDAEETIRGARLRSDFANQPSEAADKRSGEA